VFVMIPKKYRKGYSGKGAVRDLENGYGGVYWYGDTEIDDCDVLERALLRAEARRQIKARHQLESR